MSNFLSKSRFISGSQCTLKMWRDVNDRSNTPDIDRATQAIFDAGHAVGELAQQRWPNGTLVGGNYWEVERALAQTAELLTDKSVDVIYEAAIEYQGALTRVDIMSRAPSGQWDLIEVKSSTRVKAPFDTDVAMQYWVLTGAGIKVRRAGVLVLNRDYIYDGHKLDLEKLFKFIDITDHCAKRLPEIGRSVEKLSVVMNEPCPPVVEIGYHCKSPYQCPYWDSCTKGMVFPERPLSMLPNINAAKVSALADQGIHSIDELPDSVGLSVAQARVKDCLLSGEEWVSDELEATLAKLTWPIYYLDFEAASMAIPRYENTRPFDQIPFQFSCHIQKTRGGELCHREYLATDGTDPRESLANELIAAVGESGSIVVYSGYEARTIRDLSKWLPHLSKKLLPLLDRLFDLLVVVRNHYCHPDFKGSYSIKSVLPALVDNMAYDGMEIADGLAASSAWLDLISSRDEGERERVISALLKYCGQDSLAMVRLHEALDAAVRRVED